MPILGLNGKPITPENLFHWQVQAQPAPAPTQAGMSPTIRPTGSAARPDQRKPQMGSGMNVPRQRQQKQPGASTQPATFGGPRPQKSQAEQSSPLGFDESPFGQNPFGRSA